MQKLKLPISNTVSLTIDMKNIPKDTITNINGMRAVPLGTIDVAQGCRELESARENGAQILYATTNIEKKLEELFTVYLFGPGIDCTEQRNFFVYELVQSSYLGFSAKKTIGSKIIHQCNLLDGEGKHALESNLKKIMDWRNAFAHGDLVNNNRDGCLLRYFSGSPKTLKLDDEFWTTVQKCFEDTDKLLTEIIRKLNRLYLDEKGNDDKVVST